MAVTLSSQEVAALTGKTERTVRRWAESGKIPAERVLNKFNSPEYLFSLDALEPHLQQKYFDGLKLTPSPEVAQTLTKEAKPLDTYSIEEQEEIAFWLRLVKQWQGYRNKPGANKTEVDANFVQWCKLEYPERAISVDTLYRRWNAVRDNDLDGLIDKRGKWKKGKSSIPDPMWQAFLYFYLDERQHPLKKCYEYTKLEMQTSFPELVGDMPSYTTFYRRAQADIPEPLKVLGREGEKAFRDRCAPYIRRVYDDKDDAALEFREVIFGCDLLVIDDLGTELVTRYTQAEVYDLVNHRLNTGKPTIINTNLGLQEIERTYSSRVHSRLAGMYAVVQFRGRDIRLQKKQEG